MLFPFSTLDVLLNIHRKKTLGVRGVLHALDGHVVCVSPYWIALQYCLL